MILDMDFKTTDDRLRFEMYMKKTYRVCQPLTPYHRDKDDEVNYVVYYTWHLGYAEPQMILDACLRKKIGITFMAWLPISDSNTAWEKIRGRWP